MMCKTCFDKLSPTSPCPFCKTLKGYGQERLVNVSNAEISRRTDLDTEYGLTHAAREQYLANVANGRRNPADMSEAEQAAERDREAIQQALRELHQDDDFLLPPIGNSQDDDEDEMEEYTLGSPTQPSQSTSQPSQSTSQPTQRTQSPPSSDEEYEPSQISQPRLSLSRRRDLPIPFTMVTRRASRRLTAAEVVSRLEESDRGEGEDHDSDSSDLLDN